MTSSETCYWTEGLRTYSAADGGDGRQCANQSSWIMRIRTGADVCSDHKPMRSGTLETARRAGESVCER